MIDDRGATHTRYPIDRLEQTLLIRDQPRGIRIIATAGVHAKCQQTAGLKSRRSVQQAIQMSDDDRAHGEHRKCECDLRNDERPRQSSAASGRRRTHSINQRLIGEDAHGLPEWRQTEQHGGENRRAEREEKDRPVDADSIGARNVIRRHGKNQAYDGNAHHNATRRPGQSNHEPFDEILQRELPTGGAEHDADGGFSRAHDRPRQQQSRNVGASDQ